MAGRSGTSVHPSSRSRESGPLPRLPSSKRCGSCEGALPSLLRLRRPTGGQQGRTPPHPSPSGEHPPPPSPSWEKESRSPSEPRQEKAAVDCPARRSFLLSRSLLKGGGEPRMRGRGLETQLFLLNRLFLK